MTNPEFPATPERTAMLIAGAEPTGLALACEPYRPGDADPADAAAVMRAVRGA